MNKLQEFEVRTAEGRRLVRAAYNAEDCKRHVEWSGHTPISIMPFKEARVR